MMTIDYNMSDGQVSVNQGVSYHRLFLFFVLFLIALYFLTIAEDDEFVKDVSQYEHEKYRVQRSCMVDSHCLEGFVCDEDTLSCVKME